MYTKITPNCIKKTKISILFLMGMLFCLAGCGNQITAPTYDDEPDPVDEVSMFAIVSNLDDINEKITLKSVGYDSEITLRYNGGADVVDKYGDVLSMNQVPLGSIVDIIYDDNRDKLLSLKLSDSEKVAKLEGVSGAIVDNIKKTVRIDGITYEMSKNVSAFSDNNEIEVDEICSEDQISVWIYDNVICSMYVELGHGYVKLEDYASYLGGMVEIGYDVIVPVTENMLLTVREGEYTLRIAKGDDVGTKKVEVIKNQETELSLADIAIEPKQMGSILFKVTPADAAVYIDGKRVNTEGAVEMAYGKHKIYITAEGYDSYSASFNVNFAYLIKEYTLNKQGSKSESTQSASGSSQNKTTGSTTGTTTATESKKTTESTTATTEKDSESSEQDKTKNKVTVSAPVGASVYLDGEYLGIVPISFTKLTGSHIITFSMAGYLSKSYTVNFTNDGKDTTLKYNDLDSIASLIE